MAQAFNKIFWGYLIVLIEIHIIVIDVLAEPIGYYLIYSGIKTLLNEFQIGNKAKSLSLVLVFLSIPTVFISQNTGANGLIHQSIFSWWSLYLTVLSLVKLILVFFIFQLIMEVVHKYGNEGMIRRSKKTFTNYMIVTLFTLFLQPFLINFSADYVLVIGIFIIIISFIMEIIFLVLLRSIKNLNVMPKNVG